MKRAFVAILSLTIGGPAFAALPQAFACKEAPDPNVIRTKCVGGSLAPQSKRRFGSCFPFSAPRRFRGFWRVELEGSYFYSAGTLLNHPPRNIWLDTGKLRLPKSAIASMQGDTARTYVVDVIGRRTLCATDIGLSRAPDTIIVDRILTARLVAR